VRAFFGFFFFFFFFSFFFLYPTSLTVGASEVATGGELSSSSLEEPTRPWAVGRANKTKPKGWFGEEEKGGRG
jgi:hypothetical protein